MDIFDYFGQKVDIFAKKRNFIWNFDPKKVQDQGPTPYVKNEGFLHYNFTLPALSMAMRGLSENLQGAFFDWFRLLWVEPVYTTLS